MVKISGCPPFADRGGGGEWPEAGPPAPTPREVLLRVEGLPAPPPLLRVDLTRGQAQVELLLEAPPGDHRGLVVAEGGGLRREAPFRLQVAPRPPAETFLEGVVYVGTSGPRPQGAGASLGYLRFCPTGCPGRPLGGGWYRAEGLLPQGLAQSLFGAPAPQMNLPDHPIRAQGVAEPLFPRQWNLRLSRFPEAWGRATGAGVVVAVPDTGVLGSHPDLQGALLPGLDLPGAGLSAWRPPRASPTASWPSWTGTATATATATAS